MAVKSEIELFVVRWMDLETVILSEMSDREKQMSYDIAYIWNLKKGTNELIYKKDIELQM